MGPGKPSLERGKSAHGRETELEDFLRFLATQIMLCFDAFFCVSHATGCQGPALAYNLHGKGHYSSSTSSCHSVTQAKSSPFNSWSFPKYSTHPLSNTQMRQGKWFTVRSTSRVMDFNHTWFLWSEMTKTRIYKTIFHQKNNNQPCKKYKLSLHLQLEGILIIES